MEKHVIPKILRIREVMQRTGLAKSTIYAFIREGKFPKPVVLGRRGSGWIEDEIHDWILERLTERKGA